MGFHGFRRIFDGFQGFSAVFGAFRDVSRLPRSVSGLKELWRRVIRRRRTTWKRGGVGEAKNSFGKGDTPLDFRRFSSFLASKHHLSRCFWCRCWQKFDKSESPDFFQATSHVLKQA